MSQIRKGLRAAEGGVSTEKNVVFAVRSSRRTDRWGVTSHWSIYT